MSGLDSYHTHLWNAEGTELNAESTESNAEGTELNVVVIECGT